MSENETIRCPNCDSEMVPVEGRCPICGAKQLPPRVVLGGHRAEFALTPDEEFPEPEAGTDLARRELDAKYPGEEEERFGSARPVSAEALPGGFVRRLVAFAIDLVVVGLFCAVMSVLSLIGYKVGLAAHGRTIGWQNSAALIALLTWGWTVVSALYFVLLHGADGQTVGKRALGLRVVGEGRDEVGYARALLRWLAEFALAPLLVGFLWVLVSRERKAWHDLIAGTRVVRV
ncbi:MAG TPA: RDD family protein [candidate division Zixibacteria bacterium]|nr:RDD family protein [candidate division Zixibacteria bacterium]